MAFQATEAALLDVVQTADDTTSTLAWTGNVVAAASVGARDTSNAVTSARRTVTASVSAAVHRIRGSVRDPRPAATNTRDPAAHRFVEKVVHRAVHPAMSGAHADGTAKQVPRSGDTRFIRIDGRLADIQLLTAEAQLSHRRKQPVEELKSQLTQGDKK